MGNYRNLMNSLLSSKRSKAILGIGLVSIGIGIISKKVISYPAGGCMKGTQEITFNQEIKSHFIWGISFFIPCPQFDNLFPIISLQIVTIRWKD